MPVQNARTDANDQLLGRLSDIVGAKNVLTGDIDTAPYRTEWRGYYHGRTPAVVKPGTARRSPRSSNSRTIPARRSCRGRQYGTGRPQTPDESVARSCSRSSGWKRSVRSIRKEGPSSPRPASYGSVCRMLQRMRHALSAARSALKVMRIGGKISPTSGHGRARYGTRGASCSARGGAPDRRDLERPSRSGKDNSGYDRNTLHRREGTLGVITAAVLKLFPRPRGQRSPSPRAGPAAARSCCGTREKQPAAGSPASSSAAHPDRVFARPSARRARPAWHSAPVVRFIRMEVPRPRRCRSQELAERASRDGAGGGERPPTRRSLRRSTRPISSGECGTLASEVHKHSCASIKHDISVPSSACLTSSRAA